MKPETLQAVLLKEHRDAGLYLEEPDDHEVQLKRGDEVLAGFSQLGVTIKAIRTEAQWWLDRG